MANPTKTNYYDTFHKNKDHQPPTHNIPFCIQYLVCGHCNRGKNCKFSHADPRDVQLEKAFDEYCEKAYAHS